MRRVGDLLGKYTPRDDAERGTQRPQRTDRERLAPPPDVCPHCKGKGYLVYDVEPGDPRFNQLVPCRCTQARLAVERARTMRDVSNMGALARMTFENFLPDGVGLPEAARASLHEAYNISLAYAQNSDGWLVLLGGYGSGKTHLAAAIANSSLALGRPAMFVVVPDLLDYLRAAFGPSSETGLDERLDAIREAPLLILDDLGAHNSTAWAQEKLFQIINHRYNGRLATVITTNQRLEEIDPRISSRLSDLDLSQLVEITSPDFRGGSQNAIGASNRGDRNISSLGLHTDQTFDSFSLRPEEEMLAEQQKSLRDALTAAREYAEDPYGWLVLLGTYGSGKTHLAAAIANEQIRRGQVTPMFVVVPDLLDHLRGAFSPNSTVSLDRVFEQVKTASLLVLDDLGTENATPWAKEKLFQLLNYRYVARLPTIITTYNKIEDLDPHLASRMSDVNRCTIVRVTAPTYRGSRTQERIGKRGRRKRES
jgi:DNA replication protein DnaC